jgi:4-hydroxybenzoate polyprenyltransferase
MVLLAKRVFHFFVFSNLFIACCAVLMAYQTSLLVIGVSAGFQFLGFVFFATLSSYSFHWYLTPDIEDIDSDRLRWLMRNRRVHLVLLTLSVAGVAYFGYFLLPHWKNLAVVAIATFLYSAPKIPHPLFRVLRKVALGKTIFLAFVWMYVTSVLPIKVSTSYWYPDFTLFAISRFFLIYGICILFDYRDRDYDRSIGIRSLITWLSEKWILYLYVFSLLVFAVTSLLLLKFGWNYQTVGLLIIPGLILTFIYKYAITHFSDILFYFYLDGLMALSALLTTFLIHN